MSNSQITEAVNRFLTVWDGALAGDIAASLSCTEVEALADVCRAGGQPDMADYWIKAHSIGDEPGDAHHNPALESVVL